ncbi:MAG TPA: hypothetical protein VF885_03490 [Arthrobacter sp.]
MKQTLATLLVAGALAVAGLSAATVVSATGGNAGQGSVEAVNWWPDTVKPTVNWWPDATPSV